MGEDGRLASQLPSWLAMVCGHLAPRDGGPSPPARHGSPYTHGRGTFLARALSHCAMNGKEHRLVTPTRPTMVILTQRKVTIQHQLVVPSRSSDDNLSQVKHDAQIDLNPGSMRIHYTQEPALVSDSPPLSPLYYMVSG
jgi:hypothetical protein